MNIDRHIMNEIRTPEKWKEQAKGLWGIESHVKQKPVLRPLMIAAVVCACIGTAAATVQVAPVLGDFYENNAGYEESSFVVGESVTSNGWTMTLNDVVADDYNFYAGFTLTAPEGIVLDAENYLLSADGGMPFDVVKYEMNFPDLSWSGSFGPEFLEDNDPTDNKIQFIFRYTGNSDGIVGQRVKLSFCGLAHSIWHSEEHMSETVIDCKENWNFKFTISDNQENMIVLEPNVPVTTLGVDATITKVVVTSLGTYVTIEGEALKDHNDWLEVKNGDYNCTYDQKITLYTTDGVAIPAEGSRVGSECSEDLETPTKIPYLYMARRYKDNALIDINSLAYISICGVEIPLS